MTLRAASDAVSCCAIALVVVTAKPATRVAAVTIGFVELTQGRIQFAQ
jgi:hypothetical protein